uniref:Sodium/metabolite cotransporter BASS4, chloroplastic n=1 Tax=Fagus sylvatica TaxID=28930 RepID=A0A2N9G6M8_FAGSY
MTKITFIDLPHEICAAARAAAAEAAAKTAAATKISKQEEKAIVKPNNHLPSRLSFENPLKVPWIQVSRSRSLLLRVKPAVFLVAIGMGATIDEAAVNVDQSSRVVRLLHLVLLAFNILATKSLSAVSGGNKSIFSKKENASALVLVASQKTLPVMVAVVEQLGGAFGESGLLVLPCVAAHLNQIIMDSFLVNFWLPKDLSSVNAKVN